LYAAALKQSVAKRSEIDHKNSALVISIEMRAATYFMRKALNIPYFLKKIAIRQKMTDQKNNGKN
jgi:hypothetical protein